MTLLFAAGTMLMVRSSHAAAVLGEIWQNVPTSGASTEAPASAPDATFTTATIDYSSANGHTLADFLNHPTFTDTSPTFDANAGLHNTVIRLNGQAFLNAGNNSVAVPRDVTLSISGIGIVLSQPGSASPSDTQFTAIAPSSGLFNFTLQYSECCGPPARLAFHVNGGPVGQVPEPDTVAILGVGLLALAAAHHRRRSGRSRSPVEP